MASHTGGLFLGCWGFLAIPLANLKFLYRIQPSCVTGPKLLLKFIYYSLEGKRLRSGLEIVMSIIKKKQGHEDMVKA